MNETAEQTESRHLGYKKYFIGQNYPLTYKFSDEVYIYSVKFSIKVRSI